MKAVTYIYFQNKKVSDSSPDLWKISSGKAYAYFFNSGEQEGTWSEWSAAKVWGEWDAEGSIYRVTVPNGYSNVILTRGTAATFEKNNGCWNQTHNLTIPTDGNNLLSSYANESDGTWTTLKFYIKSTWNSETWSWKEMSENEDGTWSYAGIYDDGATTYNWNVAASDDSKADITGANIKTVGNPTDGNYCKFTLDPTSGTITITNTETVTVNTIGDATYVTTNALDFTNADIKAFVATAETADKITLTQVNKVPAGTPIVVKGTGGNYNIPYGSCTSITDVSGNNINNILSGSTTKTYTVESSKVIYAISKTYGDFRQVETNVQIPIKKAYLISTIENPTQAKALVFGDEESTSIKEIKVTTAADNKAYNLAGQRVNTKNKGIVIINGKKFVNK